MAGIAIHAAARSATPPAPKRPQIHILGAKTLTDLRIEAERARNPLLRSYTPEQILQMSDAAILADLGLAP